MTMEKSTNVLWISEEAIEERGQELIKKVLSDEYNIRIKAEFNIGVWGLY